MNGGWTLRRDAVIRERADQTDSRVRRARGDDGEVGMLGFADIGETKEAMAEFDDATLFTQGVKRVGVHPQRDQIARRSWPTMEKRRFESFAATIADMGRTS